MDGCCGQGPSQQCRCYTDAEGVADAVRAYVRRRITHPQDVEDVTQDTLLRLYRSVEELRDAAALEGWMYRIARNTINDYYRRAPRQPVPLDPSDVEQATGNTDEEPAAAAQLAGCVGTMLTRLPEDYRRALELTDLGTLTQQDAATQLGLSSSGMKSRVQRGRRLLRAEVRRCCEVTLDSNGTLADATPHPSESACHEALRSTAG